jgi:glycosyltransferase involved in cell wall biosynthesis
MFGRLQQDFPEVFARRETQFGFRGNRYLRRFDLRGIAVLLPEAAESGLYGRMITDNVGPLTIIGNLAELPWDCEFLYAPDDVGQALSMEHLRNVCLCLTHHGPDFVVVSHSLKMPPEVAIGRMRNHIVFRTGAVGTFLQGKAPARRLVGRVLRLLPGGSPLRDLSDCFDGQACEVSGFEVRIGSRHLSPAPKIEPRKPDVDRLFVHESSAKPVVFVLPIFLAVGGVERVTLEIIRQLRSSYEFIIINTEQLNERLGSLHEAAQGLVPCFELAELSPQSEFPRMLRTLRDNYEPALVWICNGSPWQFDNAKEIREIFRKVPIVDQSVYDNKEGWISRYHEEGIQSFDRFVAINRKIYDVFTGPLRMDPAKIDLIYSAVNVDNLGDMQISQMQRASNAKKFGIVGDGPLFAFIGRLTAQKRPLFFLEVVRELQARGVGFRFLLIGDGVLATSCQRFMDEHRLTSVQHIPFCDRLSEIYPLLSGLIVTSEYEGLPVVVLEALSMGVPVLATDVGDIQIVLEEYQAGSIVCDVNDPKGFADRLVEFSGKLAHYRSCAVEAGPKVRARFSGASVAALYDKSFQAAIRCKQPQLIANMMAD